MRTSPSPSLMSMLKLTKDLRIPTGCKLSSQGLSREVWPNLGAPNYKKNMFVMLSRGDAGTIFVVQLYHLGAFMESTGTFRNIEGDCQRSGILPVWRDPSF